MIKFILLMMFSAQLLAATIELTWNLPELLENGEPIGTITRFNIYQTSDTGNQNVYEVSQTSTSFQIFDVAEGAYSFEISTVIPDGNGGELEGEKSGIVAVEIISQPAKIDSFAGERVQVTTTTTTTTTTIIEAIE